jgi:uncharacterized protein (DUF58 family)
VLRQVNLLVGMAGLMVALLVIHYQLILQALSRCTIERIIPHRICVGDTLQVEVVVENHHTYSALVALEFRDELNCLTNANDQETNSAIMLFPEIRAGQKSKQAYDCTLTRRGIYSFSEAELRSRYPFGLMEGVFSIGLADRLVVCPRLGLMTRSWRALIDAEHDGQQKSKHRRGLMEADFYALREWRNGDSRRWIHWRTSAKLGTLSVRQFEQRKSSDLALVCDLWQPEQATQIQLELVEKVISFAATAVNDLATHGGAHLTLILAGKSLGCWEAAASSLFVQELLEQMATCHASHAPHLAAAATKLHENVVAGTQTIVLSTRSREAALAATTVSSHTSQLFADSIWLNANAPDFSHYFSCNVEIPK